MAVSVITPVLIHFGAKRRGGDLKCQTLGFVGLCARIILGVCPYIRTE